MEAIIKVHSYEDYEKSFVENWKKKEDYKFDIGKVNFWHYTIELSGGKLLCCKKNSRTLEKTILGIRKDTNLSEDDFESVLYEAHLDCLCRMIYE